MAGETLDLCNVINEDQLGVEISKKWIEWNTLRANKIRDWNEIRNYIFATDTTTTTNSQLPWRNKTTIPKLCQIRDNLHANYMASLFPKRKWLEWEASAADPQGPDKAKAIKEYMSWVISQPRFKTEMSKLVLDYIDTGNAFAMAEWMDETVELEDKKQVGYVGPTVKRISPLDIVFNPVAASFIEAPKIIRSIVTIGEAKEIIERLSSDENKEEYEKLFQYMYDLRAYAKGTGTDLSTKDAHYSVDGFTSYQMYLASDYVEILTFYGDLYDYEKNEFLKNHQIMVVDRHKVISKKPNPSFFGYPPIFHAGWRKRQDNLWAMGPLDNLVGLQYRIDHLENLKADVFDLIAFPVLKIKGYVDDFKWEPFAKIYTGEEGDVDMLAPPFQILQANIEIAGLLSQMEEMAGSPKEAMGFRTPGEKTAYEVQRLENAASRIFQNKTSQFEEQLEEPLLNAKLELARRNLNSALSIPVFNSEFNTTTFSELSPSDLTGAGRIKPIAARHFAEKAEMIQNLTQFFGSQVGADPGVRVHFSGQKIAKLVEDLLEIQDYELVTPFVQLSEDADGKRIAQQNLQNTQMEALTPSGLRPDDSDQPLPPELTGAGGLPQGGPPGSQT